MQLSFHQGRHHYSGGGAAQRLAMEGPDEDGILQDSKVDLGTVGEGRISRKIQHGLAVPYHEEAD